jgi:hypothetical protein
MSVDPAMSDEAAYFAVRQLCAEWARRVDHDQGRRVEELFVPDGVYESDGRRTVGAAAIRAAYESRVARGPRVSRHLFSNLLVLPGTPLRSSSVMVLYARDGSGPMPPQLCLVADVADEYVWQDGQLLLVSRALTTVFVDDVNPPVFGFGADQPE